MSRLVGERDRPGREPHRLRDLAKLEHGLVLERALGGLGGSGVAKPRRDGSGAG